MQLPSGYSVAPRCIRLYLDAAGNLTSVGVDWALSAPGAPPLVGDTYRVLSENLRVERWLADGKTVTFTTPDPVYGGASGVGAVAVDGVTVAPSEYTVDAHADGTVSITFATAPPAPAATAAGVQPKNVAVVCQSGPSLSNAAGDIVGTLGLAAGEGTVYEAAGGPSTSHRQVSHVASLLRAWAAARVAADEFSA